jgi:predicted nucleic acid-binding protein
MALARRTRQGDLLIADTSAILASLNENDRAFQSVRAVLDNEKGRLVVPELVLAEVDYLTLRELGRQAEEAFLEDVLAGAWSREPLTDADLGRSLEVIRRYSEHEVGLVDASIVATAERLRVVRILTLDRRHFRTFRLWDRKSVTVVP